MNTSTKEPAFKRLKLSAFRDSYFTGDNKPTSTTLINHIKNGQLSGQKVGGNWYVNVTGWGEPLSYSDNSKQEEIALPFTTGNKLADRILQRVAA